MWFIQLIQKLVHTSWLPCEHRHFPSFWECNRENVWNSKISNGFSTKQPFWKSHTSRNLKSNYDMTILRFWKTKGENSFYHHSAVNHYGIEVWCITEYRPYGKEYYCQFWVVSTMFFYQVNVRFRRNSNLHTKQNLRLLRQYLWQG